MLPRTVREALSRRIVCSLGAILRAAAEISICLDIGRIFGSAPLLAGFAPCGRGSRFLSPSRLLGRRPRSARGCSAGAGSDLRGRGCLLHSPSYVLVSASLLGPDCFPGPVSVGPGCSAGAGSVSTWDLGCLLHSPSCALVSASLLGPDCSQGPVSVCAAGQAAGFGPASASRPHHTLFLSWTDQNRHSYTHFFILFNCRLPKEARKRKTPSLKNEHDDGSRKSEPSTMTMIQRKMFGKRRRLYQSIQPDRFSSALLIKLISVGEDVARSRCRSQRPVHATLAYLRHGCRRAGARVSAPQMSACRRQ
jgi:hypothetical protein